MFPIFFLRLRFRKNGQTGFKNERVMDVFGLGKYRSSFGKWMDREGISQTELAKKAKVSNDTISRCCKGELPTRIATRVKIDKAIKSMGYDKNFTDFF